MSMSPFPIEGPANAGSRSMSIERYAQMRAEMETGRLRDEVLSVAGITADAWTVVQREWLERMGTELDRGRFELTNRYTQAFLARQRELAAPAAAPTRVVAAPAEPPPAATPPPVATALSEAPDWMPKGMRAFADVDGTQIATEAPPAGPVLPFDPSASPVLPALAEASAWLPKGMRGVTEVGATVAAPQMVPGAALPFAAPATPSPEAMEPPMAAAASKAPDWMPKGMRALDDVEGTQVAPEARPADRVLPFDPSAPPALPAPTEAPAWLPKGMRGITDVAATVAAPHVAERPALPFGSRRCTTAPDVWTPELTLEEHALPRAREDVSGTSLLFDPPRTPALPFAPAMPRAEIAGGVVDTAGTLAQLDTPVGPALPFQSPAVQAAIDVAETLVRFDPPPRTPVPLTLEQHAMFTLEIVLHPEQERDVLARHCLTPRQKAALDQHYREQIAANPELRAAWNRAYHTHYACLMQRGGPSR